MPTPLADIEFSSPVTADIISQNPVGSSISSHIETTLNETAYTYDESTISYDDSTVYYNNTEITKDLALSVDIIL